MGFTDFFMKLNVATGGKNPSDALIEGVRSLGLAPTRQSGAFSEYVGWYQRRQAMMTVDGNAVMGASAAATMGHAGSGVASALGLVSGGQAHWATQHRDQRARGMMQSAPMSLRWSLRSPVPLPGGLRFGRDPSFGPHLGGGLHGGADPHVWPRVAQADVVQALGAARLHVVEASGLDLVASWMPPMSEYQGIVASPPAFVQTCHGALHALSVLADALCGPPG